MVEIRFKKTCNVNGKRYKAGKRFKPTINDISLINKLNEDGYIEPLARHNLFELYRMLIKNRGEDE